MKKNIILSLIVSVLILSGEGYSQDTQDVAIEELMALDLESLLEIEIVSVSRKAEKLFDTPAAVYVITQEDIRRTGVTSIPEALRMVPGMNVARIDANTWAVSSRGFNDEYANKMLVMVDGRTVYTHWFAGVTWNMVDTLLEDIERIEVIRGPGGTTWGTNAVNGIISIITKNAKDTQGGLVTTGFGSEEKGFGAVRYGEKLDEQAYWRVYAKYFDRDNSINASDSSDSADGWDVLSGGFRIDWDVGKSDSLTLQGDVYDGDAGRRNTLYSLVPPYGAIVDYPANIAGRNILTRWNHIFSEISDMTLQLYYDWEEANNLEYRVSTDRFDLDFQHHFLFGERQEVVWGCGYRFITDESDNTFYTSFDPQKRNLHLFSAFLQDEIMLWEDKLSLMLGSKFEHNYYTGFEYQPSTRLLWRPHPRRTIWTSVTRAVRVPSRIDQDIQYLYWAGIVPSVHPVLPTAVYMLGDKDFETEELLAYELGYRERLTDRLLLDIAMFYNEYDNLTTLELDAGSVSIKTNPAPHIFYPYIFDNKMYGETYGVELMADWQVLDKWRLRAAYTYLQMQMHIDVDSIDTDDERWTERMNPHNQFSLHSFMNLTGNLEFDLGIRYVDNISEYTYGYSAANYLVLDFSLGWQPTENLEVSIGAYNLLDDHHPEFPGQEQVEHSVYGKLTWRF